MQGEMIFASTDLSLARDLFADIRALVPGAKMKEDHAMPAGGPQWFRVDGLPKHETGGWWLLKLFCERGGEPFAVDSSYYYVRFKD